MSLPTKRGHTGRTATLDECQPSPHSTAPVGELPPETLPHAWGADDGFDTARNDRRLLELINDLRARVTRLEERTAPIEDQVRLVVERSTKALGSKVVRILHSFKFDHSGDDAIFFRVVLPDSLCGKEKLYPATRDVERVVREEIAYFNDFERLTYFNYRSETETKEHPEPEWE